MANYGWTLWACIQREVSDIDFDFWEWGVDDKYARAVAAFTGPELRAAGSTTCSAATDLSGCASLSSQRPTTRDMKAGWGWNPSAA